MDSEVGVFDGLLNNTVSLLKVNGQRVDGIKASVQKKKIFIDDSSVLIEVGDLIEHRMSNGATETYEVLDPGFKEPFAGIDAHYQIEVQKLGIPRRSSAPPIQNNISIGSMTNSHFQQVGSGNASFNLGTASLRGDLAGLIESLKANQLSTQDPTVSAEYASDLQTIESQLNSPRPKIGIIQESVRSMRTIAESVGAGVVVELLKKFMVAHHLL